MVDGSGGSDMVEDTMIDQLALPDPRDASYQRIRVAVATDLTVSVAPEIPMESSIRFAEFERDKYAIGYPPTKLFPWAQRRIGYAWRHLDTAEIWRNRVYFGPLEDWEHTEFLFCEPYPDNIVWE